MVFWMLVVCTEILEFAVGWQTHYNFPIDYKLCIRNLVLISKRHSLRFLSWCLLKIPVIANWSLHECGGLSVIN